MTKVIFFKDKKILNMSMVEWEQKVANCAGLALSGYTGTGPSITF